jgi:hypothetical protein
MFSLGVHFGLLDVLAWCAFGLLDVLTWCAFWAAGCSHLVCILGCWMFSLGVHFEIYEPFSGSSKPWIPNQWIWGHKCISTLTIPVTSSCI